MHNSPVVSVCIPTYNSEEYVGEAIESVLAQTFDDMEIIVGDGGSTDRTIEIVRGFDDDRITVIQQKDENVAEGLNNCFSNGSGKYYAILEADDLWEPSKLETQINAMELEGYDMSHTNAYEIDETGQVEGKHAVDIPIQNDRDEYLRKLFLRNFICTPSVVIRSDVVGDRPFDESFDQSGDHDLWLRIAAENDVGYIDEPHARKRYHGDNLSEGIAEVFEMRKKTVDAAVERFPELRSIADKKMSNIYFTYGMHSILDRNLREGRKAIRKSITYDMFQAKAYVVYMLSYIDINLIDQLSSRKVGSS